MTIYKISKHTRPKQTYIIHFIKTVQKKKDGERDI